MGDLKISIITATFNSAGTLEDTLRSVMEQTYPNIEHIIVDGGSTDKTISICSKYSHIARLVSEPDKGIYDAMNKGVRLATGDIIGILNSDDVYADKDVISEVMQMFSGNRVLDILYGDLVYVATNDLDKIVRRWRSKPYYPNFFRDANVPPHPTLFVKSQVYKDAGLFDLELRLAADYEFMLRVFTKHQFTSGYIPQLIVKLRLGGATNKTFGNIVNGNKEILKAWRKNGLNPPVKLMPLRVLKRLIQFIR